MGRGKLITGLLISLVHNDEISNTRMGHNQIDSLYSTKVFALSSLKLG